jgi:hypothetical protein
LEHCFYLKKKEFDLGDLFIHPQTINYFLSNESKPERRLPRRAALSF